MLLSNHIPYQIDTHRADRHLSSLWQLITSMGSVCLMTMFLLMLYPNVHQSTISLLYILIVLVNAIISGLWAGMLTSVLVFLALNYFFMLPYQMFGISSFEDAALLFAFVMAAMLVSGIAGLARSHAFLAANRASELATLYGLSQAISAEVDIERILPIILQTTTDVLRVPACQILLYDGEGNLVEHARIGNMDQQRWYEEIPLNEAEITIGILRVARRIPEVPLSLSDHETLQMIATQVLLVLERARLVKAAEHASVLAESNALKSTLLSSVSHDLRTPLAVIKGAVTNLLDEAVSWDYEIRHELLTTIDEETNRLNRLVGELLDMSRIEVGALEHTRSWYDPEELIECVVERMRQYLLGHDIQLELPRNIPLIQINYTYIDHVLTNLLENVAQHTPHGTPVTIKVEVMATYIQIEILDRGPGIPNSMLTAIFEKFVRVSEPERPTNGTGLGLAICKGLVEIHGGKIWAENRPDGGARFVFILPRTLPKFEQADLDQRTTTVRE